MSNCEYDYYEVKVTKTMKPMGRTERGYETFDRNRESFDTLGQVRQYLEDTYNTCKRVKMYRDLPDGEAEHIGWIYCFKNSEADHGKYHYWWQQDWVDVIHIQATTITKGLRRALS